MTKKNLLIKDLDNKMLSDLDNIEFSSNRQYKSVLNVLKREAGDFKLKDIKKIIEHQKKKISKSKLKNQIIVLLRFYKKFVNEEKVYKDVVEGVKILNKEVIDSSEGVTKKEIEEYIKISKDVKSKISSKNDVPLIDLITMYLYTNLTPRRTDNRFLRVNKGKNQNKKFPHINVKNKKMFYPPHKTDIITTIELKNEHDAFINAINHIELHEGNKLYRKVLSNGLEDVKNKEKLKKNSQKAYSVYVKKIFKKHYNKDNYTIQRLRRLFSSKDYKVVEELKRKAKESGHSLNIHVNQYVKIKDNKK